MTRTDGRRVAVVTGGSRGIGAACAAMLAEDGMRVVVFDRDPSLPEDGTPVSDCPDGVRGYRVDVSDAEGVASAVGRVLRDHGRLDVLINNAGISGPARPTWETPIDYWHAIFDVHTHGTFYLMRAAIPPMIERGYGRVVNIASVAGKEGNVNTSAYSAAKAAVIGLTKSAGKELATSGVLVNAVAPGLVETQLGEQVTPSHRELLRSKIPMGRGGQPEEVAELVRFLASDRCTFSTGAVFDASGGRATY